MSDPRSTRSRLRPRRLALCAALSLALAPFAVHAARGSRARVAAAPRDSSLQKNAFEPPRLLRAVEPVYPDEARKAGVGGTVLLHLELDAEGRVADARVVAAIAPALDAASLEAARRLVFAPARQSGRPVPSSVDYAFHFEPPEGTAPPAPPVSPPAPPASPPAPPADVQASPPMADEVIEIHEHVGPERALSASRAKRAASDFRLDRDVLAAAPRTGAGDLLGAAPGVYVSRPEGDAVAHQIFLRGFDAEHGQDIELTVGGVPVNQPGHLHGQGYADLNFLLPEVVHSMRVTEGVYDPQQGDFAVAGSIDFRLGVADRGYRLQTSLGSFGTLRQLALWAPPGEPDESFAAVAVQRSDGFGANRGSLGGSAIGQLVFDAKGFRGTLGLVAHGARAGLAGVLRKDDVDAGRVGFYESYPDPSANAQSALGTRTHVLLHLERPGELGAQSDFDLWVALADFRQRANFTGYTERAVQNPEWTGRGDLVEQENHDLGLGARVVHRSTVFAPVDWAHGQGELGLDTRTHWIDQAQNLLQQPDNETWDRRVDASLRSTDLGAYVDLHAHLSGWLDFRGGARADVLYFDVDDRLANFTPSFQRQMHLIGFRRTAMGVAFGPRASLEVQPLPWLDVVGSYGQGFRSPQPRQLAEGEDAPFARVHAGELGLRLHPLGEGLLEVTTAAFLTSLSSDLAFDPAQARLERIGPTTRKGLAAHVITRPLPWALASVSATFVHATLDAPPPATAENPLPPYSPGQRLPYVPPLLVRAELGGKHTVAVGRERLDGRLGLGLTLLGERPLPYGQAADGVALLDAGASLRWRWFEGGVDAFNLLDARYAATAFSFVSSWSPGAIPSRLPAQHLSAGAPRTVLFNLGVRL